MKKVITLIVAVAMILSLASVASFADYAAEQWTAEGSGINGYWLRNADDPECALTSAAVVFKATDAVEAVGTNIYWSANPDSGNGTAKATLKIDVYEYNTDYATTVAGTVLASASKEIDGDQNLNVAFEVAGTNCTFTGWKGGNGGLMIAFTNPLAAGQYMVVITNTGDAGSYTVLPSDTGANDTCIYYKDSNATTEGVHLCVLSNGALETADPNYAPAAGTVTFHGASFDTFYINGAMPNAVQTTDGSASAALDAVNRTVDGSDGSIETISVRGWIGFDQAIEALGYQIGDAEPVFGNFTQATEDAVKLDGNGGALATRFQIDIPVADVTGTQTIVAVAKVNGQVVKIDSSLATVGAATTPNTSFTYVGKAAASPATADASMVVFMAAAAALVVTVVLAKKKEF